jgi:protein involved in polysaccharide export with SLBB domain
MAVKACMAGFLLALVTFTQPAGATQLRARVQYQNQKYLLGPGDILKVQVQGEPEYTENEVLVHPDGHAVFAGIGEIDVAERSVSEVTYELTERLKRYLVSPRVTVALVSTRPSTLYVHGAVMHPGMFQMATSSNNANLHVENNNTIVRTDMRLSNVLANAGGVLMNADLSNVQVTRTASRFNAEDEPKKEVITVNLWRLLKEGAQDQDILLQPGDVVYVPEAKAMALNDEDFDVLLRSPLGPQTFPVRVIGDVKTPGVYNLDGTSPLLNTAIAKAGGFDQQANRKVIAIRRFSNDQQSFTTFFIEPKKGDIYLRPNDVVYISENKLYKSGRFFQQVANVLAPFQSVATTGSSAAQIFGWGGWAGFRNAAK